MSLLLSPVLPDTAAAPVESLNTSSHFHSSTSDRTLPPQGENKPYLRVWRQETEGHVQPVAWGPTVVQPVAWGPTVVQPVAWGPTVVKPVAWGPTVVQPVAWGPTVVQPVAWGPTVVLCGPLS
uniref:Uncharacterized protein n=1 Tax=Knipowitschia caucasica TaxID=637954 RepID=A0AAV2J7V2_KNICA